MLRWSAQARSTRMGHQASADLVTAARAAVPMRAVMGMQGEPVPSAEDRPAGWADEHRIWITDQLTLR